MFKSKPNIKLLHQESRLLERKVLALVTFSHLSQIEMLAKQFNEDTSNIYDGCRKEKDGTYLFSFRVFLYLIHENKKRMLMKSLKAFNWKQDMDIFYCNVFISLFCFVLRQLCDLKIPFII